MIAGVGELATSTRLVIHRSERQGDVLGSLVFISVL